MNKPAPSVDHEQRFRSLFENNLDFLLFQNREGVIVDVNTAFPCSTSRNRE
ncbi:PAS domain S-box protein [Hymenobacter mucosus]|uniref:PAS domain S-box-containing protein n=1 Tax=Hymenobacter mucosus TaxID=1411120 RepID=A0A238ZAQ3_9BACT|nr:PAS domain S-box-containing protein [Hymenobacter mucosus]